MDVNRKFDNYDFDGDDAWKRYLNMLEQENGALNKTQLRSMKMKWYSRNIDPAFVPISYQPPLQTPQPPPSSTTPPTPPQPGYQVPPANTTSSNPQRAVRGSVKEQLLQQMNKTAVYLCVAYVVLSFLPLIDPILIWRWCILGATFTYLLSLFITLETTFPGPGNLTLQSFLASLQILSKSQDLSYILYCFILLNVHHTSVVAVFPIALNAFYQSPEVMEQVRLLGEKYTYARLFYYKLLENVSNGNLLFWSAAAELLTLVSLSWKWMSGGNPNIGVLDLLVMSNFISQRITASTHTRLVMKTVYNYIKTYIPNLPDLPF